MNLPTVIIGAVVLAIFLLIVIHGIHDHRHHKGGCSCGCGDCPGKDLCHPQN